MDSEEEQQESDDEILNPIFKSEMYGYLFMGLAGWILTIPALVWLSEPTPL